MSPTANLANEPADQPADEPPSPPPSTQTLYWQQEASAWLRYADRLDAQLDVFGTEAQRAALSRLGAESLSGVNAADVGCGSGRTTLQLAASAGPTGAAVGIDVNAELLALARERATNEGAANASFVCADAANADLRALSEPASTNGYDLIYSRFGVMFFADAPAAFANLLAATRPAGVLAFVCWGASHRNPWMTTANRAAMELVTFAPPRVDPFAFGEPSRISSYLAQAGWRDVQVAPFTPAVTLFGGGGASEVVAGLIDLGPVGVALEGADPTTRERVAAAMVDALRPHETDDGVTLASAAWVVTALAPS